MTSRKNNIKKIISELRSGKKMVAMVAPSFVVDFGYPEIIHYLKQIGFDKVVELTFGAKMINRDYHKILKKSKNKLMISSACPGIVNTIKNSHPELVNNLVLVDSPMIAMAKICKKHFPKHKTVFISPCDFKKTEADKSKYLDYVIDYSQLRELIKRFKLKKSKRKIQFDKFYNDYTKIYPLSGGLSKTAHMKGILKADEILIMDGIADVIKFLKNPNPKIKFMDVLFCQGGCIGGPHTSKYSLRRKRKKVMKYLKKSEKEDIPENRKGLIRKAEGINFSVKKF